MATRRGLSGRRQLELIRLFHVFCQSLHHLFERGSKLRLLQPTLFDDLIFEPFEARIVVALTIAAVSLFTHKVLNRLQPWPLILVQHRIPATLRRRSMSELCLVYVGLNGAIDGGRRTQPPGARRRRMECHLRARLHTHTPE